MGSTGDGGSSGIGGGVYSNSFDAELGMRRGIAFEAQEIVVKIFS